MKKLILIVGVLIAAGQCYAQATKNSTNDTLNYREKFTVLASNPKIRDGKYMLTVKSSGKILTTGFYKNNQKDSIWREFDLKDNVAAEGYYKHGKKTGEWVYYGKFWKPTNKYDFDKGRLSFHEPTADDNAHAYRVINGNDTTEMVLSRAPIYLGGLIYRTALYNLTYPAAARSKKVRGRVMIDFTVGADGLIRDYKVIRSLGYGCDEEALRIVKLIPQDWVPGNLNGKNVEVVLRLPVVFDLR